MKKAGIEVPEGCSEVLLHACCAPCSSAIVEWMLNNGVRPTIFYYNPNIWPREEYEIRKEESKRHAESLGVSWIDGDYEYERWISSVSRCEVRGTRCEDSSSYRGYGGTRVRRCGGTASMTSPSTTSRQHPARKPVKKSSPRPKLPPSPRLTKIELNKKNVKLSVVTEVYAYLCTSYL